MPELSAYRRAIQAALDDGGLYRLNSGSGTGGVCQDLADNTTAASTARYNGSWVYVASGAARNQQRRIRSDGLDTATGEFQTTLGWTAPGPLDEIEITHLFPCYGHPFSPGGPSPEDTSYLALVNLGLGELLAPDRISLAFAGTSTAAVTGFPWLDRPDRLVRVLEPAPRTGYPPVPCAWRGPQLVLDGPTPHLQLTGPYTGTLTLEVLRPGWSLISGAESTAGFTAEGQTALPAVDDVREAALMHAYRVLANRNSGGATVNWTARYTEQRQRVAALARYDQTRQRPAPVAPSTAATAATPAEAA